VRQVVIDEVQRVPGILDEVHWLHENRGLRFALCGSSARKVRRGQANLLGGRAQRYELFGLTATELDRAFDLDRMLNHGYLPRMYESPRPHRMLASYVGDYLREEVAAEGAVRNLPAFSEFLGTAALADAELLNYATIARDCGVSAPTVRGYFEILEDTLLGRRLPAFTKRPKRRVIATAKFYFADVGVVGFLARRGRIERRSEPYGKACENWVFDELAAANAYLERFATLSYWRLAAATEVDFIIDDVRVAIEAKATARVTSDHLKGLRSLIIDHPSVKTRIVVCLEPRPRTTEDGIRILPAERFAREVAAGEIF